MSSLVRYVFIAGIAAGLLAGSAAAQLIPSLPLPTGTLPQPIGGLPIVGPSVQQLLDSPPAQQAIRPTLNSVAGLPEAIADSGAPTLLELRRLRLQQLIRDHRALLEAGDGGLPVRRGIVVAIDPDPVSLQLATRAGFRIVADETDAELGLRNVQMAVPPGLSAREGLRRLRRAAPRLDVDYDHVFEPAGGSLAPIAAALAAAAGPARGRVVGMIDGGVASHPSLGTAAIEQRGFAGSPQATGHGTAVASLLVGTQGPFRGAAAGARLYVADVYGGNRAAGSATAIVRALGWLAGKRAQVINVSLVGPSNRLVQRAIQAVQRRGIGVVAAVGNDGPAAPPQYPASYSGVIAVTGVDARGRALPEAGKPTHLDFAAPGADMAAALPGRGFTRVRGTSFAAPLAAARLALAGSYQRLAAEARPGKGRVGRGIVCTPCRVDPRSVGAR